MVPRQLSVETGNPAKGLKDYEDVPSIHLSSANSADEE